MSNAKYIIYRQDVYTKTNQSKYTPEGTKSCYLVSGNLTMVDVTNKLLDVRKEIVTAVNTIQGLGDITPGVPVHRCPGFGGGT